MGVRRLVVANGPNIFQMLLVNTVNKVVEDFLVTGRVVGADFFLWRKFGATLDCMRQRPIN